MRKQLLLLFVLFFGLSHAQEPWQIPKQAEVMENPFSDRPGIVESGRKIYKNLCVSCHGAKGAGDTVAAAALNPKPTDFTTAIFQKQTEGSVYWKLSEGRGIMASYKNILSEEQRWSLVAYLRTLGKEPETIEKKKQDEKVISEPSIPSEGTKQNSKAKKYTNNGVDAFPFTQLVNAQTTHIIQPKGFGLTIQHRFGVTQFDEEFFRNFMGLDLSANMRFAFEIPVNEKIYLELGRTRYGKYYDFGGKYLIFQQTKDNKKPVSLVFYGNVALSTEKKIHYPKGTTFSDGRKFKYQLPHRVIYNSQFIVSRKFSDRFSFQIASVLIWRNLAPTNERNYIFAFPVSLRYKTGLVSAIDLEIAPDTYHKIIPISLAYEIASSGSHVFQITITNSNRILEQKVFTEPVQDYSKGKFILGFNLKRYF